MTEPLPFAANDAPECECAMTEASFRACPLHGEKAVCPECGEAWLDHPSTCVSPPGGGV